MDIVLIAVLPLTPKQELLMEQRFKCKSCGYYFTVENLEKIDDYYVNKALQLYLEGLTYREIGVFRCFSCS